MIGVASIVPTVIHAAVLSVLSFSPSSGDIDSVTSGTLLGTGFADAVAIELEPYVVGIAFTIVSDTEITLDLDGPGLGALVGDSVDFRVIRSVDEATGTGLFTFTAPAFDPATLNLSLWLKAADLVVTHPSGGTTRVTWPSAASAGVSGDGREVFENSVAIGQLDDGPSLGAGLPTLFINRATNNQVHVYTDNTHGTGLIDTDVVTTTECSFAALVYVAALSGAAGTYTDPQIMGVNQPRIALLVGGAANNKAELSADFAATVGATLSVGAWGYIQGRFKATSSGGAGLEARWNQGSWVAVAHGALSLFGEAFVIGAGGQGPSMNGYYADLIASPEWQDDTTFDGLYSRAKTDYPSASLP